MIPTQSTRLCVDVCSGVHVHNCVHVRSRTDVKEQAAARAGNIQEVAWYAVARLVEC